jgi:hypothetical protein
MHPKDFFGLFTSALNPLAYKDLMKRRKRDATQYFLKLLFFSVILSGILSIPYIIHFPDRVDDVVSKFSRFNITKVDIEMNEPITLLGQPKIVLDLRASGINASDEFILITKTDVYMKKFKPSIFSWRFFETEKTPVGEYSDVLQNFERVKSTYLIAFIFLLPSIFFVVYTLHLVKYALLILISCYIGYLICFLSKAKIRFSHVLRTAVFSSTLMVILDVGISPLINLGVIPLLSYILMYSVSLIALCSKRIDDGKD